MRIVSLLPSATEIVCALGLRASLVGITHECDEPEDVATLPRLTTSLVGEARLANESRAAAIHRHVMDAVHGGTSLYAIDRAGLRALAPDLILTQALCEVCAVSTELLAHAARDLPAGANVLSLEPTSLAGMFDDIRRVADATGTRARGDALVADLTRRADALGARTAGRRRPRTAVLEWTDPPMGSGHWTPALVELAGGTPVVCFPGAYSEVVTWSELEAAAPEVVIVVPCGMDLDATRAAVAELGTVDAWNRLAARARVVLMDGHRFANRPGPRLIETAERFADAIHPELAIAATA